MVRPVNGGDTEKEGERSETESKRVKIR